MRTMFGKIKSPKNHEIKIKTKLLVVLVTKFDFEIVTDGEVFIVVFET